MIAGFMKKIFGSYNDRYIKKCQQLVSDINKLEDSYQKMSDSELKNTTATFRSLIEQGKTLDEILPQAFGAVREVSKRTLNMRHFDVQLVGGYVLHKGKISEMRTGEGKTLVASLSLYLNALEKKGSHLVTVNDYLARRDAQWMGPIYLFLGLTVGVIQHEVSYRVVWKDESAFSTTIVPCTRKEAYDADITYGTNNEFGFDYLRDNMKYDFSDYVQKELNYAIVDEVDSILIDEARTPLIISGPTDLSTDKYYKIDTFVRNFKKGIDYTLDEKEKNAKLTDEGINKSEEALKIDNLFDVRNVDLLHFVNNALKAHAIFNKDVDYVVQEGKILIVDEFTGRLMPGRRYSDGLHQALEAKEQVKIENENQTLASITFQNYFRMYKKLAGMTGTALTEANEFREIYGLDVISIPTNKPMIRKDHADQIYKTVKEKYEAIAQDIIEKHKIGRPVLVGTISIEKSEVLSKILSKKGIPHEVLNAKNHEREAHIVEKAGEKGAVTIATNMAGRGTDIKVKPEILSLGGLHIVGTERHESRRIDNQLRGRTGRQGDQGSSRFYLSLEDDLLRIFGSQKIAYIMDKLGMKEGEPIEHPLISKSIENAQKKVEGMHFEIRKHLLDYDNVMNQQRNVIYSLRRDILTGAEIENILKENIENVLNGLLTNHVASVEIIDEDSLQNQLKSIFEIEYDVHQINKKNTDFHKEEINRIIQQKFEDKKDELGQHFVPFSRFIMMNILDNKWKEHLLSMDHLRDSVGLRGYGQKDPLIEYKKESYRLFVAMLNTINFETVELLFHVKVKAEEDEEISLKNQQSRQTKEERKDIFEENKEDVKKEPVRRSVPKVGRNDPCPCGSGKKYKKCCGASEELADEDQ